MPYIKIDTATERDMEKYCQATGVTIERAIKAALAEWYEMCGEPVVIYSATVHPLRQPRARSLRKRKKRIDTCFNVIQIDSRAMRGV